MSTILVTGGAGFVGSHFARAAREAGLEVVILDDLSGGAEPPANTRFVRGDIGDAELVARLVREYRFDAVAHFAGKIAVGESVEKPDLYFDHNVTRTLTLLAATRDVPKILFSSSAAVYGIPTSTPIDETAPLRPVNPYGQTKLEVERALERMGAADGRKWCALRYFNAAGAHPDGSLGEHHHPETHLIPLVIDAAHGRRGPLTIFGDDYPTPDGTCIRDYVHVCDLADAHLAALTALEQASVGAINLGSASGFSVREVLDEAANVMGRPVPHIVGGRREGDPPVLVASNARARAALGFQPLRSDLPSIIADAVHARIR